MYFPSHFLVSFLFTQLSISVRIKVHWIYDAKFKGIGQNASTAMTDLKWKFKITALLFYLCRLGIVNQRKLT